MFWYEKTEFTDEHDIILQTLDLEHRPLGTVVQDVEQFLIYLATTPISLTPKLQISGKILPALNQLLTRPDQVDLKRPALTSYPQLSAIFLLLRATGLTITKKEKKKTFLHLNPPLAEQWHDFCYSEKYGILLESWLLRGHSDILGEPNRMWLVPQTFQNICRAVLLIPEEGLIVTKSPDIKSQLFVWKRHEIGGLRLFGFWNIQDQKTPLVGKKWHPVHVQNSPIAIAFITYLQQGFIEALELISTENLDRDPAHTMGLLQKSLQRYFPEWKRNLILNSADSQTGRYTLKVTLDHLTPSKFWRQLEISAEKTLNDLVYLLLESIEFDRDHLWRFTYSDSFGIQHEVYHPFMDGYDSYTDEVTIGALPVAVGESFQFLFDFGDQWKFTILIEKHDVELVGETAEVIDQKGDSPKQYPDWDEND